MKSTTQSHQPPAWLQAMQNGTLGEARAKAFLLDRFWVLERSVDIDGADFIIQRRSKVTPVDELGLTPETDANERAWPHRDWLIDGKTEELKPGELQIMWAPGRWGFSADQTDRNLDTFRTFPFPIYRESVEVAYARRFLGEEAK